MRNGTISGFGAAAVGLGTTSGAVVEGVRAIDPRDDVVGLGIEAGPGSTVSGNIVSGSLEAGIGAGAGSIVSGNTVLGAGDFGIAAGRSTVSGNSVGEVGETGIFARGGTVSGNTVRGSPNAGIEAGPGSTVSGNTVEGDGEITEGIRVNCPSNVIGNTSTNNPDRNLVLNGDGCTNIDNLAP